MKVVIEHLDEELFDWCIKEYLDIFEFLGKERDRLLVTNMSLDASKKLCSAEPLIQTTSKTIKELVDSGEIPFERVCLLDSETDKRAAPTDRDEFDYILVGGILGNVEEFDFDKTKELRKHGFKSRHLGEVQMPTNTATRVAIRVMDRGEPFDSLRFIDYPEFKLSKRERIVMPFRYEESAGQPLLPPGVLEIIKRETSFDEFF